MSERAEREDSPADAVTLEGEAARAGPEPRATHRRSGAARRSLLLLWLAPVALILAIAYLVAAEPGRVALFLAGAPPEAATPGELAALDDRLGALAADTARRDELTALADADEAAARRVAEALAELRAVVEVLETELAGRLGALDARLAALEGAEPPVDPALREGLAALDGRVAALEGREPAADPALARRMDALEAARSGAQGQALAELEGALAALERRLERLAAASDTGPLESRLAETAEAAGEAGAQAGRALEELALLRRAVEQPARGADWRLAAARLRLAVDGGGPFEAELAALQAIADAGLGGWTAFAAEGVPTRDTLVRRFKALARAHVARPEGETGTPWLDDAIDRLSDVVSIRRVDKNLPGAALDAVVGRAEAHIDEGSLAGAVAELEAGEAPPFAEWLAAARARLAADAELPAMLAGAAG